MFKTRLVLMSVLVAFVMAPVQAAQVDSMDDIFANGWTDDRDPGEGTGLLFQSSDAIEGTGSLGIDYGVTNDSAGVPNPLSGWDYLGNWVGVGGPRGCWGDPAICDYWWTPWCNSYHGKFDRVPNAPFGPQMLTTDDVFALDVKKTIANSPEHVRELQLYDSLGNRNTYQVQAEATAISVGAGWKTYVVPLSSPLENNADLTDIVNIKLWVSSWSFAPNYPGAPWPEYTGGRPTGTKVLIDNLRLLPVLEVDVDIKPESCPNPLGVRGQGVLPVAILGSCDLDVHDIDAASIMLAGVVSAIRSNYDDVSGPATVQVDSMDDIFATGWTDDRDPAEGTGWLKQNTTPRTEGTGSLGIDYGVTNDSAGVSNPLSGWDYLGNFVGVGAAGGCWGDPAICDSWWPAWCNSYHGKFDRVPNAPFGPQMLTTDDVFLLDVYKTIANSPEHVRELQLYDSLGNRNTYQVQAEATASSVGAGWKTYCVPLSSPLENNADLTDIVNIKLWVSSWSAYPDYPGAPWPEYTVVRPTGTPVIIDNLRLVNRDDCACTTDAGDGLTDLTLKFDTQAIVQALGEVYFGDVVPLTLTGVLLDGQRIEGVDCILIRGPRKPKPGVQRWRGNK